MPEDSPGYKEFHIIFGSRIKAARKKRGFTIPTLAYLTGLDKLVIERTEYGWSAPTLKTAYKMALALRVSLSDLVRGLSILEVKEAKKKRGAQVSADGRVVRRGRSIDSYYRRQRKKRGYSHPFGYNGKTYFGKPNADCTRNADGIRVRKRKKQTKADAVPAKAACVLR